MMRAAYPGTFDPITKGHADVAARAARMFDEVVVLIGTNPAKTTLFSRDERVEMARAELKAIANVRVDSFDGLLVDYMKERGLTIALRGIRSRADFDYEYQMALTNRALQREVETLFIPASPEYSFVTAQFLREIAAMGGKVDVFVSPQVGDRLRRKFSRG
jgi:pantetheine-phosphate adenylyltransferase